MPTDSPKPSAGAVPSKSAPVPTSSTPAFTPDLTPAPSKTPTTGNYLSNGQYDYNNLGDLWDQTVFLGTQPTASVRDSKMSQLEGNYLPDQFSAATTLTANDLAGEFAGAWNSNPDVYKSMQMALYYAQAYSGKPSLGQYGLDDQAAMNKAIKAYLGVMNRNGGQPISFSDYLDKQAQIGQANAAAAAAAKNAAAGASRAPLQMTSNATLDQVADTESQSNLGRNASQPEQVAFQDKFHGEEQSAYNNGSFNAGDPSAEAQDFIQKNNNAEYQTHLQAGYADQILKMLGVTG